MLSSRQSSGISLITSETILAEDIYTPQIHTVTLGNSTTFSVVITNVGNTYASYSIDFDPEGTFPASWFFFSDISYSINLNPGQSSVFHVTLRAPSRTNIPNYADEATLK
ncbi:MAG: hypothetical protein QW728_03190, partial [Thermoplasmata archaeon]